MSLIKKIKNEVNEMGLLFLYDNGVGIDKLIAETDFTQYHIVVYAFLLSTTTFKDGKESANIGIFFSKLTDYDQFALENDTLQDECKRAAFLFLKKIEEGNILTHGDVSLSRFYDTFSSNVTGVGIVTEISESKGLTLSLQEVLGGTNKFKCS